MKWLEHLKTITAHKIMVMRHCFAVGLYKQGLLHDLSKYSWTEFSMGANYYQGNGSPNDAEREDKMFCDRVAACKIYNKENYYEKQPLDYYMNGRSRRLLHPDSAKLLEKYLNMLARKGEAYTFRYIHNYEVIPLRRKKLAKYLPFLKYLFPYGEDY